MNLPPNLLSAFVTVFVTIGPIETAVVFAALTAGVHRPERKSLAARSVMIAGVVLLLFALGGGVVLSLLHVSLPAFRVAGGVLLFLQALTLTFSNPGLSSINASETRDAQQGGDIAIFPLAFPLIAGPGSLAAVVLVSRHGEPDLSRAVLDGEAGVVGRLSARGLDDELHGSAYAVVEGLDGRPHHVRLSDLDHAGDAPIGAMVEVRSQTWGEHRSRTVLRVRSDLDLQAQVRADGATWLDRQLVGTRPDSLGSGGFADEVRDALSQRADHLAARGLARRGGARWIFARDLLETLRADELAGVAERLAQETGRTRQAVSSDGAVSGTFARRLDLASGRFAMLEDGLGFTLVPWRPDMDRHLGQRIEGVMRPGQGIAWNFAPKRGLGR